MFRKRTFIMFLSIVLLLQVYTGGSYGNSTKDSFDYKSNTDIDLYISHDPIRINNQSDLIKQASSEGWKGDGTSTNPYIIENYNISQSSDPIYPLGIAIFNTQSYISIQNCFIKFQGELSDRVGIYIGESANIVIKSNSIELNRFGIELENTKNVNVSTNQITSNKVGIVIGRGTDETEIRNNSFANVGAGIWFSDVASSTNIIRNDFMSYNDTGIQISFPQNNVLIQDNIFEDTSNPISMNNADSIYITNNIGYSPKSSPDFTIIIVFVSLLVGTLGIVLIIIFMKNKR